jgi:hypothetical protein
MREKTKGAHIDSETAAGQHRRRQQPGAQDPGSTSKSNIRKNQQRLDVTAGHKTREMEKRRRGTFP